ncbi:MAG: PQQ-binding-like beta-propeller repeat protein [candidate division Zixibacteria bacterium]|nr:PQQ-binding-like beta-propeller repeat protein [candidate division Zixibacteria bacterium]
MKKCVYVLLIILITWSIVLRTAPKCRADDGWQLNLDSPAIMCKIVDSTRGIISTSSSLAGVNLHTGQVDWTIKDWYCKSPQHIGLIPNTHLAVAMKAVTTQKRNSMSGAVDVFHHNEVSIIDIERGTTVWSKDTLTFLSCVGYSLSPQGNALLMCVRDSSKNFWMMSVDIATGDVIWENREFFDGRKPKTFLSPGADRTIDGNQPPVFDTDTTMITIYRKNQLRKWSILTGKMLWESDLNTKGVPYIAKGITPIMLSPDRNEIWVPCKKGLQTVSVHDGSVKWSVNAKLPGLVKQIIPLEKELLIIGGPNNEGKDGRAFITLLNQDTGERVWEKDFRKLRGLKTSPALLIGDSVYIYSDKKVFTVALADGSYREVAKDLKFEGGEAPKSFSIRDGNFLLISAQNMMMLDPSCQVIYHSYHKAPGTAFFLKALAFTAQVALNTVSAMYFSVPIYSGGGYTWFIYPALNFGLPKYGNSTSAENHMFVLCKVEANSGSASQEGWGMAKINKSTGHIDSRLIIGNKNPEYDIAPAGDAIMYLGKDESVIYKQM